VPINRDDSMPELTEAQRQAMRNFASRQPRTDAEIARELTDEQIARRIGAVCTCADDRIKGHGHLCLLSMAIAAVAAGRAEGEQRVGLEKDARIEKLERALREVLDGVSCDHLHHKKSERHGFDTPCPVYARLRAALEVDDE
jgi:hypothetical protein